MWLNRLGPIYLLTFVFSRRLFKLLRTTKLGGEPVITPVPPTNTIKD